MHSTKNQALAVIVFVIGIALVFVGFKAIVRPNPIPALRACTNNLRQIESAKLIWLIENNKATNAVPTWEDIHPYLSRGIEDGMPTCPKGGSYIIGRADEWPRCSCGASLPEKLK